MVENSTTNFIPPALGPCELGKISPSRPAFWLQVLVQKSPDVTQAYLPSCPVTPEPQVPKTQAPETSKFNPQDVRKVSSMSYISRSRDTSATNIRWLCSTAHSLGPLLLMFKALELLRIVPLPWRRYIWVLQLQESFHLSYKSQSTASGLAGLHPICNQSTGSREGPFYIPHPQVHGCWCHRPQDHLCSFYGTWGRCYPSCGSRT